MESAYYGIPSFNKLVLNSKLLKLFCLIVGSNKNKEDKLNFVFKSITHNLDILLYCETWLNIDDDSPYCGTYEYHGLVRKTAEVGA